MLAAYFGGFEPMDTAAAVFEPLARTDAVGRWQFVRLYLFLPERSSAPPTLAMAASFPPLQQVVLVDLERVGRRIGTVLLANICGQRRRLDPDWLVRVIVDRIETDPALDFIEKVGSPTRSEQ
jgi:hypothetical protein